jgi:hypothetical protein
MGFSRGIFFIIPENKVDCASWSMNFSLEERERERERASERARIFVQLSSLVSFSRVFQSSHEVFHEFCIPFLQIQQQ